MKIKRGARAGGTYYVGLTNAHRNICIKSLSMQ